MFGIKYTKDGLQKSIYMAGNCNQVNFECITWKKLEYKQALRKQTSIFTTELHALKATLS